MSNKKLATISIKGKEYVTVAQRVLAFNEMFPNGKIETEITYLDEKGIVRAKCKITPDIEKPERYFVGHSEESREASMINKTSATENCETSAVGRALGLMGIGIIEGIASADEVKKAQAKEFVLKSAADSLPKCAKCGSAMKISTKSGKPYCAAMCWKKPETPKQPPSDDGLEFLEPPF